MLAAVSPLLNKIAEAAKPANGPPQTSKLLADEIL